MKLKQYDYVNVSERTEEEQSALVDKFIRDGAPRGEGYTYLGRFSFIGWREVGVFYFSNKKFHSLIGGRQLTYEQAMEEDVTPCEELGYKVGDRFVVNVLGITTIFSKGTLVELYKDDGSDSPLFNDRWVLQSHLC